MRHLRTVLVVALFALISLPAQAYVGPGAGLSLMGALWALLIAVGSALVFLVAWPLRRMRRRRAEKNEPIEQTGMPPTKMPAGQGSPQH